MHDVVDKKLNVTDLIIETTRRCNMRCEHCLRGDPEDKNMPRKYLENLFARIAQVDVLTFTGGEPALGTDAMYTALELCSKHGIPVRQVYVATNGKDPNRKFLDALRQWDAYCRETQSPYKKDEFIGGSDAAALIRMMTSDADGYVGVRVDLSMDRFHEDIPAGNILALMSLPGTLRAGRYEPEDDDKWILRTGQAEWNGMGQEETQSLRPWAYGEGASRISLDGWESGTCSADTIYASCTGHICGYCDYDYTDIEEYAAGTLEDPGWLEKLAEGQDR